MYVVTKTKYYINFKEVFVRKCMLLPRQSITSNFKEVFVRKCMLLPRQSITSGTLKKYL